MEAARPVAPPPCAPNDAEVLKLALFRAAARIRSGLVNSPTTLIADPDVVLPGLRAGLGEEVITTRQSARSAVLNLGRDLPRLLLDLPERAVPS